MLSRAAAAALALLLGAGVALAQMPPTADANIQAAYADLDKYEQQVAGNPSAVTAKRILRLLSVTDGRLRSSQNKAAL